MASVTEEHWLTEEIADFLASCPSREELLAFRPSPRTQERVRRLLGKLKANRISGDEQRELDQYEYAEMLMRLVKARLRTAKSRRA